MRGKGVGLDTSKSLRATDLGFTPMHFIETGDSVPRNPECWRAILDAVEKWPPGGQGGRLEAHFDGDELRFVFTELGERYTASFDITWITYADQADRIGLLARTALIEIESNRSSGQPSRTDKS